MDRRPSTVTSARIRNFCIIAHIDHGKSTLADRFLEITGTVRKEALEAQTLDSMELEKERGITIKAKAVMMKYKADDGQVYTLNLIDTPGHVDFSYEVSKALQACEGALLLVDAAQGIEAQTVANYHLAERAKLRVIPVINKIDLPTARPELIEEEFENILLLERERVLRASAKTGIGVKEILETVVRDVPPPTGDPNAPMRALVFDSVFDDYRGVIVHVRVFDGSFGRGDKIRMKGVGSTHEVLEVGTFIPGSMIPRERLRVGETGYMIANIKTLSDVRIGDTVCLEKEASTVVALPGYKAPQHMVFCGIYPTQNKDFDQLRRALEKLSLNDASFSYTPESSDALGFGFRCGFLGLLHMEIVQERLERESNVDIVQTAPNVTYEVLTTSGETLRIESPAQLPDPSQIEEFREPVTKLDIIAPAEFVGGLLGLAIERRGRFLHQEYISETRVMLSFEMPLAEIIFDFYDKLKSLTRGYGTMDYEVIGFRPAHLVRLRILVSGSEVDALSTIVHRDVAEQRGRKMLVKLREEIPRHMFEVALQAAIGGKIIARESIRAMSKNVTAKCYGGDITRKRKLLEKQKEGKKRMKMVGNVEIPQKAFLSVLGITRDSEK
ncbi:MAG: elongation factor 4 [Planctomycetes bacterium]|nr:elongation factor 4 [Planctomycetota bacterium]